MKKTKNEEAVSPVIGVILMVVITVIIAAMMAVFVFEIGAPQTTPMASVKIVGWDVDRDNISLQHVGGDVLRLSDVKLVVEQTDVAGQLVNRSEYDRVTTNATIRFAAGDRLEIGVNETGALINNIPLVNQTTIIGSTDLTAGNTITVSVVFRPTDSIITQPKVNI